MAWTKAALGDRKTEIFNVDNGFSFDTTPRFDPDVILATYTYPSIADNLDKLNAIALSSHTWRPPAAHLRRRVVDRQGPYRPSGVRRQDSLVLQLPRL